MSSIPASQIIFGPTSISEVSRANAMRYLSRLQDALAQLADSERAYGREHSTYLAAESALTVLLTQGSPVPFSRVQNYLRILFAPADHWTDGVRRVLPQDTSGFIDGLRFLWLNAEAETIIRAIVPSHRATQVLVVSDDATHKCKASSVGIDGRLISAYDLFRDANRLGLYRFFGLS